MEPEAGSVVATAIPRMITTTLDLTSATATEKKRRRPTKERAGGRRSLPVNERRESIMLGLATQIKNRFTKFMMVHVDCMYNR